MLYLNTAEAKPSLVLPPRVSALPHPVAESVNSGRQWSAAATPYGFKGKWTPEEDQMLRGAVQARGQAWAAVAEHVPGRTRKQCRDRWLVHARSSNHTPLTLVEQTRVIDLHRRHGNHWKRIADQMVDRSERHIKNLFGTRRRAKTPNQETLLHAYIHDTPTHTLSGLDAAVVYATVDDTRQATDRSVFSLDVQVWYSICQEAGLHVYLAEVPAFVGARTNAQRDARLGMDAYVAAVETAGLLATRLLVISSVGVTGVLGVAHHSADACAVLGRLGVRLWELNRRAPEETSSPDRAAGTARKRRRTTM